MLRAFGSVEPSVDPTCHVDPSAQVIGDVGLGPESSVWMNAVIRGDINRMWSTERRIVRMTSSARRGRGMRDAVARRGPAS